MCVACAVYFEWVAIAAEIDCLPLFDECVEPVESAESSLPDGESGTMRGSERRRGRAIVLLSKNAGCARRLTLAMSCSAKRPPLGSR
jgi:hypothetical protein